MTEKSTKKSAARRIAAAVAVLIIIVFAILFVLKEDDCFPDPEPEPVPCSGEHCPVDEPASTSGPDSRQDATSTGAPSESTGVVTSG